jgi:hypothetical protein
MERKPRAEGARASDVHDSEQRNSTSNASEPQRSIDEQIRAFRPWEPASTIELRWRLNKAAVCLAARATRAESPHSRVVLWLANEIASKWLWARDSDEQLRDVLWGINRLVTAADAFERNGSGL